MRVLIVHNRYRERGGEDSVVAAESAMLERRGDKVERLLFDNDDISGIGAKLLSAATIFYSNRSAMRVKTAIDNFMPDIVHIHNFVANLTPSAFFAAKACRVPVVMTLHNFRLLCTSGVLFRNGKPCEECLESGNFLPAVSHGCYRGSRLGSAALGGSIALHSLLGTWQHRVDRYIALTEFAASKMGGHRVPADKIRIKPNFVPDHGIGSGGGGYALYVGRLSPEKGLETIIEADEKGMLKIPVWIAGDGLMRDKIKKAGEKPGGKIRFIGMASGDEVLALMKGAEVLLLPSIWYEGFPMVCAEAYSVGLPVLSSRIGGLPEIVQDGITGKLFAPGDAASMTSELNKFFDGTLKLPRLRQAARQLYLDKFCEARNYDMLTSIYGELVRANQVSMC